MKKNNTLFLALALSGALVCQNISNYTSSWIGNTFGGKTGNNHPDKNDTQDDWVQDYIDCMYVADDGTCYTSSGWDEAGRTHGVYKNGDVLGNNNQNINCSSAGGYSINGTNITGNGKTITDAGNPVALAMGRGAYAGKLLVADNGVRKQILIYDVSGTPAIIEKIGADGGITSDYTSAYDFPMAINAPAYLAGHYAPGVYHPWKLWGLTGVGCDNNSRIFVSTSELGSAIRCFKKVNGNWILDWRVENYFFVDNVYYDEKTDAVDIYGIQEHIKMDFSKKNPGQEWSIYGYSLDKMKYPEDPRGIEDIKAGHEHGLTACIYRELNGVRYLFSHGMTCQPPVIFKYKPGTEIAVPCAMFFQRDHRIYDLPITYWWPPQRPSTNQGGTMFWSDLNNDGKYQSNEYSMTNYDFSWSDFFIQKNGNLWQGVNPVTIRKPTFDANGNISYFDKDVQTHTISGVGSIGKIIYQEDKDRVVLLTTKCRDIDGGKVYIVENWSGGNRAAKYVSDLKGPHQSSWTVAGDYAFEVGWETRAQVWVTDLNNGNLAGTMIPDASCGGLNHTGWVDIASGIQAFKRSNGQYLIFVEDDYLSRVLLYRWCPTGNCTENILSISPTNPGICSGSSVVLNVSGANTYTWSPATGLSSTTGASVTASPVATTTYVVIGKDVGGATKTVSVTVTVSSIPATPSISKNNCNELVSSSSAGNQWYLNGNVITGATSQTYFPGQTGNYTVEVSNGGCKSAQSTTYNYTLVPFSETSICANAISVDGKLDEAVWNGISQSICKVIQGTGGGVTANYKTRWDSNNLYIGVDVTDPVLNNSATNIWDNSAVELFLDMNNGKTPTYETNDFQYIVGWNNAALFEKSNRITGVIFKTANKTGGYIAEVAIPWSTLGVSASNNIIYGFDVSLDISHTAGTRTDGIVWSGDGNNFQNTSKFGTLTTGGNCTTTSTGNGFSLQPLLIIYPNPAHEKARIAFVTDKACHVTVKVFDLTGREVSTLADENLPSGKHVYDFANKDEGIYFVKFISDDKQSTHKIMITH